MSDETEFPGPTAEGDEVAQTGIVLVHAHDRIIADEKSKALLRRDEADVVHYHFPVEIEVVGSGGLENLWEPLFDALRKEFEAQL
jgi:hypothetical protein